MLTFRYHPTIVFHGKMGRGRSLGEERVGSSMGCEGATMDFLEKFGYTLFASEKSWNAKKEEGVSNWNTVRKTFSSVAVTAPRYFNILLHRYTLRRRGWLTI